MATSEIQTIGQAEASLPASSREFWGSVKVYLPTFLTEFVVMAGQVVVYKMAAVYLGKQGFSEYALARRTVSLIFPIPMLGLAVGLPRYIGFSDGRGDREGCARYYGATLYCVGGAAAICMLLLNVFAGQFGFLFFGDPSYGRLAFPLSVMILGLCLHTVICGYFRGRTQLNHANLLQFINLAIVPILAFYLFRRSLAGTLTGLGVIWTGIAAVALWLTPFHAIAQNNWKEIQTLLRYGLQRVPGDFILMALFTLPAVLIAHLWNVQEAGFVAFATTVLSMIGAIFAPAGLVLLPKATFLFAEGSRLKLRDHLRLLVKITVIGSFVIMLVTWVWIPALIRLYLGPGYEQVVSVVRFLVLGSVPYSLYLLLRIVIDAYHEYGVTGLILLSGLVVFIGGSLSGKHFGFGMQTILAAFLGALLTLAALSTLECTRILRE